MFILEFSLTKGLDMPNSDYANSDSHQVSTGGGLNTVAVGAGATVQGNSGTSIPCKVVYINALSNNAVNCAINVSANVSTAVMVPTISVASVGDIGNLEIPIDDINKLWFYASAAASVNITYRH
jgi:hypothetical protein